jgi:DNA-binding MarR family transcriptional regulator
MHTTSATALDIGASDAAVDELADAVTALVRTWRSAGRRLPEGMHSTLAMLQLTALLDGGEHRLGEIAGLRGVDQSVVSRQVGELQARGLVCRRPDPSDGRASLVRLTPDGHRLLDAAQRMKRELIRGALARRPVDDVRAAARLVADLAGELDTRLGDPDLVTSISPRSSTRNPS